MIGFRVYGWGDMVEAQTGDMVGPALGLMHQKYFEHHLHLHQVFWQS